MATLSMNRELKTLQRKMAAQIERGSDVVADWTRNNGWAHPSKLIVLRDGTELLTIGHERQVGFLQLIRYKGEERFSVVADTRPSPCVAAEAKSE